MNEQVSITREMGISHCDLLRLLPAAVAYRPYEVHGDTVLIEDRACRIELRLSPETKRRLGALCLPVTTLTLRFCGCSDDAVTRFMQHFERHLQRGGG